MAGFLVCDLFFFFPHKKTYIYISFFQSFFSLYVSRKIERERVREIIPLCTCLNNPFHPSPSAWVGLVSRLPREKKKKTETKTLKKLIRDIIDPSRDLGHVDGHKKTAVTNANPTPTPTPNPGNNSNNDNNDNDNINTDDIGKKESSGRAAHDVVLVIADQDPILSSTGQEEEEGEEKEGGGGEGERDSSNQQQILDREDDDDVANKSGQQGVVAMKESDQKEKVCDDCA